MATNPDNLYIDGNLIKKVKSFRYLASIMELDGSSNMYIRKRICEGRRAIGMLNSVLWSRSIISRGKAIDHKTIVEIMMLY